MRISRRLVIPAAALAVATLALQGDLMAQPPGRPPSDVNVVNTPDVRVVGAPDVTIVNPAGSPVPVVERREPFQQSFLVIIGAGEIGSEATVAVPPGRRLVIEHVSAFGTLPFGQNLIGLVAAEQTVGSSIQRAFSYMPFTIQRGFIGRGDLFTAAGPVLLFGDGAALRFFRDTDVSSVRVEASVSGYLVDP